MSMKLALNTNVSIFKAFASFIYVTVRIGYSIYMMRFPFFLCRKD